MANLINSDLTRKRLRIDGGEILELKSEHGDTIVFTPIEARTAIREFIISELDGYSERVADEHKERITNNIDLLLNEVEKSLTKFVNDKINSISEDVMARVTTRLLEAEVLKRAECKLNKSNNEIQEGN